MNAGSVDELFAQAWAEYENLEHEVKIFVEGLCRRFAVLGGRHDKAAEVLYLRRDPQGLKKKCRSGFVQLRARHVLIHPRLHHLFPFFSDLFFKAIIDHIVLAPGKTEDR